MAPFPSPFATLLATDPVMVAALGAAVVEAQVTFPSATVFSRLAISVVAVDETTSPPTFKHAGINETVLHYSGSLLKVAAMYAAFQLRRSADQFARASRAASPTQLFSDMSASFDPVILPAVAAVSSAAIPAALKVPKYSILFDAAPLPRGGFTCSFKPAFQSNLFNMIVNGDNTSSTTCVQQLGYGWINGALKEGGFFSTATNKGIWLAGGFTGETPTMPYVRLDSSNDGPVGQATTCFDMAKLYANLFPNPLVDATNFGEMLPLLAGAATGPDVPWLTRSGIKPAGIGFTYTHDKIGLGELKATSGGGLVASEGAILNHSGTGKKFISVWQNTTNDTTSLKVVSLVVDRTIKRFLGIFP